MIAAHPPGPGLPEHAPSVYTTTGAFVADALVSARYSCQYR